VFARRRYPKLRGSARSVVVSELERRRSIWTGSRCRVKADTKSTIRAFQRSACGNRNRACRELLRQPTARTGRERRFGPTRSRDEPHFRSLRVAALQPLPCRPQHAAVQSVRKRPDAVARASLCVGGKVRRLNCMKSEETVTAELAQPAAAAGARRRPQQAGAHMRVSPEAPTSPRPGRATGRRGCVHWR